MIHKSVCIARMMGCCSCFGFSIARKPNPKRKPSYSYSNHPSQEHLLDDDLEDDDDCSYNDDATSMGNAEESEQQSRAKRPDEILSFREQNGMICRQYPVKETHKVVRTEDDDGNKMVNEYVRECKIGSGSYGKVVLYRSLVDGKHYALKAFHKSHLLKLRVAPSETAMTDVLRESIKKHQENCISLFMCWVYIKSIRLDNAGEFTSKTFDDYCMSIGIEVEHPVPHIHTQNGLAEAAIKRLQMVLIMKMLEHPNIVNLIEVIDDPDTDHFYMVLEYVEGKWVCEGSGPPGGLGESTARKYLRDIVRGLMYLHDHNIVHGDIKPDNLLVSSNGTVKIGDFSVSQVFEDDNDELRRSPGTPVFTAPECCLGLTYHGKAADTWAVGVTLYCLVLGQYPFLGDTLQDTYDKIVNNPLVLPENMTPQLKNLLEGLLCKDPAMRMTLEEVADHSWVVGNDGRMPHYLCWCKRRRKSLSIREESNGTKDDCSITHTD